MPAAVTAMAAELFDEEAEAAPAVVEAVPEAEPELEEVALAVADEDDELVVAALASCAVLLPHTVKRQLA